MGSFSVLADLSLALESEAGAKLKTIAYEIGGVSQYLLGKTDAVKLGIVELCPEGGETIRKLSETFKKTIPEAGQVVSRG